MNVTELPEQTVVPILEAMLTVGVTVELFSLMPFPFDVVFTKQGLAFEVMITLIESPTTGEFNV